MGNLGKNHFKEKVRNKSVNSEIKRKTKKIIIATENFLNSVRGAQQHTAKTNEKVKRLNIRNGQCM